MGRLSTALKTLLAAQFLPRVVQAAANTEGPSATLHYRPLNGDSLREMAQRRIHHGSGTFSNPVGIPRDARGPARITLRVWKAEYSWPRRSSLWTRPRLIWYRDSEAELLG